MRKFVTIAESTVPEVYVSLCLKNNGAGEFAVILFNGIEEFETVIFESNGNHRLFDDMNAAVKALRASVEEFRAERDHLSLVACNLASQFLVSIFAYTVHEQAGGYPTSSAWLWSIERTEAPAWKTLGGWVID